jgi:hypothetical protein
MTSAERTLIEIVAFLMLIGGFALYERHRGAIACETADKVAVSKQEAHNEAQALADAKTITQEAQTHAEAISAPPMPTPAVICVRAYASPVLPATAPGPLGHGTAALPAADYRPVPNFAGVDISKPAAKIGQAADAQITELQDYIAKVCLVR